MPDLEPVAQLKAIMERIESTRIRRDDLDDQMPLHVHPRSLNYGKDLDRLEGEYNRTVAALQREGKLTEADLAAADLPAHLS